MLVLAAAAASTRCVLEPVHVYGCAAGEGWVWMLRQLLHEPRVKLWWPSLDDVVEIAQDAGHALSLRRAHDVCGRPASPSAHMPSSPQTARLGKGCGWSSSSASASAPGARFGALWRQGRRHRLHRAALALTAENTNGTNGTVATRLLDWDDDDALREVLAEGPFFAVVGAALVRTKIEAGRPAARRRLLACWTRPSSSWRTPGPMTTTNDHFFIDLWRRAASSRRRGHRLSMRSFSGRDVGARGRLTGAPRGRSCERQSRRLAGGG